MRLQTPPSPKPLPRCRGRGLMLTLSRLQRGSVARPERVTAREARRVGACHKHKDVVPGKVP